MSILSEQEISDKKDEGFEVKEKPSRNSTEKVILKKRVSFSSDAGKALTVKENTTKQFDYTVPDGKKLTFIADIVMILEDA